MDDLREELRGFAGNTGFSESFADRLFDRIRTAAFNEARDRIAKNLRERGHVSLSLLIEKMEPEE